VIPEIFSLEGRTAIVIGAGGHICSALAKGFAMAGANVAVADLRLEKSETVSKQINEIYPNSTLPFQVDASDKKSIYSLLDEVQGKFGVIQVAINGAGINSPKPFLDIEVSEWEDVINSQLTATMFGCQVFGEVSH